MTSNTDPYIGQLLISRYKLVELIGKGSMGRVYRAEDTLLGGVPVAVKFLARTLMNERMKFRFAQEARAGALLGQRSFHIVRVIDYGVNHEEVPFNVMEYLQGDNLSDVLMSRPLALPRFYHLMRHVCLGLQTAHDGVLIDGRTCPIIHRDIKPSNILILPDPSMGEMAKILDFGIAKVVNDQENNSQTQSFMGTLAYCSPEQIEGTDLDNRSDIYSLGITMFEMLTGEMPILAESHSIGGWFKAHHFQPPLRFEEARPGLNLPPELEEIVLSCLAKKREQRPQSAQELLEQLQALEESTGRVGSFAAIAPTLADEEDETELVGDAHAQTALLSLEETCWQSNWPKDKPIGEIVFPRIISTNVKSAATLWVMLPQIDIDRRLLNGRYNNFLLTTSPHPVMLWITAIYDPELGTRWLPCYLDMKQPAAQEMALLLSESGCYPLLFFPIEAPEQCTNVMTLTIDPYQRQLLRQWVQASQLAISTAPMTVSKRALKTEFEKFKPQIIKKIEQSRSKVVFK
jgi:eukaryotic-like serine/threonine-protein kinase